MSRASAEPGTREHWIERIDALDLGLFDAIPSQTNSQDRRSLLAVQRAIAKKHKAYAYLEIGSHLGGSLQPHLADGRCKKIYSIDPRPSQQPDDRSPGHVAYYEDNSAERMLKMLDGTGYGDVAKIECFDSDASKVAPSKVVSSPRIAFIDGEHTTMAVISDFQFCIKVVRNDGVVLFHDFPIIYPAVLEICNLLDRQNRTCVPLKLEGSLFGIFLDPDVLTTDPYLASLYKKNKRFLITFRVKTLLKQLLPGPLLTLIRNARSVLSTKTD